MSRAIAVAASICIFAGSAGAVSMLPLQGVADESGFGTLHDSLSSPFTGGGFAGVLDSRVYVDAIPASTVYFVWDLQVTLAASPVSDLSIASVGAEQYDLRIGEIIANIPQHGYIQDPARKVPDQADAIDRVFPDPDEVAYTWLGANELGTGDRSTVYVKTSGAVDVGQINAAIQDGGVANLLCLAPVDDPSNPDLNIPEPATMALLVLGSVALIRRR